LKKFQTYYRIIYPEQQSNIGLECGEAWKGLGKEEGPMACFVPEWGTEFLYLMK
jgi:hypothetical protein